MGEKPDDYWTVPLDATMHREQHATRERRWWTEQGIDPLLVAALLGLASRRNDFDAARAVIDAARVICAPWTARGPA